nr:reverse transcriptase domain-containing protein [Tanacetum cinerariifolium]
MYPPDSNFYVPGNYAYMPNALHSQATMLPQAFQTMTPQDPFWNMDTGASSHLADNTGNIIKIFYHGLTEATQEALNSAAGGPGNTDTNKIMARMDAMSMKMDAQYKEMKYRLNPLSEYDEDDQPITPEEEAKFMQTFRLIRVKQKKLILRVGPERINFNTNSAMENSYSNYDTCFSIDVIDEILEEDFDALLDERSQILHSIEGTILEEKLFAEFDEFIEMTAYENPESKSEEEP